MKLLGIPNISSKEILETLPEQLQILIDQPIYLNTLNSKLIELVDDNIILGYGGYGVVYKANIEIIGMQPQKKYAIKLIAPHLRGMQLDINRLYLEIKDQTRFRSSARVLDIFGYSILQYGTNTIMFIIMELCEGINLFDFINCKHMNPNHRGPPCSKEQIFETLNSDDNLLNILREIANGLKDIHTQDYAWRDLKPENIMVSVKEGVPCVKLIDFGLGEHKNNATIESQHHFLRSKGTHGFLAPESHSYTHTDGMNSTYFLNNRLKPQKWTNKLTKKKSQQSTLATQTAIEKSQKTDIYSFGILIAHIYENVISIVTKPKFDNMEFSDYRDEVVERYVNNYENKSNKFNEKRIELDEERKIFNIKYKMKRIELGERKRLEDEKKTLKDEINILNEESNRLQKYRAIGLLIQLCTITDSKDRPNIHYIIKYLENIHNIQY